MRYFFCVALFCWINDICAAEPPSGLTTDLLEHTDRVFLNGYPANISLEETDMAVEPYKVAAIRSRQPYLGWIVNDDKQNTLQTAFQILVASRRELLDRGQADIWDSGKVPGDNSTAVKYEGKELQFSTVYYWKVRTWNNHGECSPYSPVKGFMTGKVLDNETAVYPLQKTDEHPVSVQPVDRAVSFVDFGKDAFGRLRVTLSSDKTDTIVIHIGEHAKNGRVDRNPGGTVRYAVYNLVLMEGIHTYTIKISPDKRNTGPAAIKMPDYTGEVMPFRYCEIEGHPSQAIRTNNIVRETVHYPFNDKAASFTSSDTILNQVWDLCKYSVKATSFAGIYVDGDRERIPYEADALINQLCHYSVDREFSMARRSHEYLVRNATWPTEWIMQSVLMAWNDYLYTGNPASLLRYYTDLKSKTLTGLEDTNGLISTTTGKQTTELLRSVYYGGNALRDIVDWPHTGILGLGKSEGGETDGFQFTDYNTVVNAYHYEALKNMRDIAKVAGNTADMEFFGQQAKKHLQAVNEQLLSSTTGLYIDGTGTEHSSLHANMFPLAFNMVPGKYISSVTGFVRSRGMACSVYGSQFLLDAVYNANCADYGLELLASSAERSWYNMIRAGSTISMEAWDNKYKPNQDWNHAWGAAPANLIPRKLMGIEPLGPGYRKMRIKPQPATLEQAEIIVPTIRGEVKMSFKNDVKKKIFVMDVTIPHNSVAEIWLPFEDKEHHLTIDGAAHKGVWVDGFVRIDELGSGTHRLTVTM